jgi:hypothetical protein
LYINLWVKKPSRLEALRQGQLAVLNNPGLVTARQAELALRGIGEKPEKLPVGGRLTHSKSGDRQAQKTSELLSRCCSDPPIPSSRRASSADRLAPPRYSARARSINA